MHTILVAFMFSFSVTASAAETDSKPNAETLINSAIADIDSHHALMTRVSIPAGFKLPRHYHPSEEFLYVIEGSSVLQIDGQPDITLSAGMAAKIPAEAVHTAVTTDKAAEVIIFRVQPNGQPVRIPVKETGHD